VVKTAYPTVISFDSIPACDRQMDGPKPFDTYYTNLEADTAT